MTDAPIMMPNGELFDWNNPLHMRDIARRLAFVQNTAERDARSLLDDATMRLAAAQDSNDAAATEAARQDIALAHSYIASLPPKPKRAPEVFAPLHRGAPICPPTDATPRKALRAEEVAAIAFGRGYATFDSFPGFSDLSPEDRERGGQHLERLRFMQRIDGEPEPEVFTQPPRRHGRA